MASTTGITRPAPPPSPPLPTQLTESQSYEVTSNIRSALRRLRLDDMASIAQQKQQDYGFLTDDVAWFTQQVCNVEYFIEWIACTWYDVTKAFLNRAMDPLDMLAVAAFGLATSVLLAVLWVWCSISTAPVVVHFYERTFGKTAGGLSIVNGMNPKIFRNMTKEQCGAAKEKLAETLDPVAHNPRAFSLDIAKFLLQVSSIMYERNGPDDKSKSIRLMQENLKDNSVNTGSPFAPVLAKRDAKPSAADIDTPGLLFDKLVGPQRSNQIKNKLISMENEGRVPIDRWAQNYDMCFEPVSELATVSEAYCSIFWDPNATWIIVGFKGTDPRSFREWTTDFSARFEDASRDIPGFLNVHRGFKERIFPSNITDEKRKPWHTIREAIKIVSHELTRYRAPDVKCNVWFTGHSLGTAIASLAYAKALISDDIGDKAILRDAYLFATPITTDVISRNAFNAAMYKDQNVPRTLWRVTNRNDFVATGLPAFGDRDGAVGLGPAAPKLYTLDTDNLFAYCHLGIEIFMKTGPRPCQVSGNRIEGWGDFNVHITSKFSPQEVIAQRQAAVQDGLTVWKVFTWLQDLPLVGMLAAHASTNYYDQLDQIAISATVDRE